MTRGRVVLDFETYSELDLSKVGAHVYSEHHSTEVICLSYQITGSDRVQTWAPWIWDCPADLVAAVEDGYEFWSHGVFDRLIWQKIMDKRYFWPWIEERQWRDLMASCAYRAMPLKMERAAEAFGLTERKDMAGHAVMKKMCKPGKDGRQPDDFDLLQRTMEYCSQDVRTEVELLVKAGHLPHAELKVWQLDQTINDRGVKIDLPAVEAAIDIIEQLEERHLSRLYQLTDGVVTTANQAARILKFCKEQGLVLPNLQADTVADALSMFGGSQHWKAREVLEIRQILGSASIKKYYAMRAWAGSDDRARGMQQYHGAHTGRWAGRGPQPHNMPRGSIKGVDPEQLVAMIMFRDPDLLDMIYGSATKALATATRMMFIPETGCKLVVGDFSAIEAVVLACLAGEKWKMQVFHDRKDVYCETAAKIFKRPINADDNPVERQVGKICELAFGYGGGVGAWRNFDTSDTYTDEEVDEFKKEWRGRHPRTTEYWKGIEAAAINTVLTGEATEFRGIRYAMRGWWLTCQLPSGRLLWYRNPRVVMSEVPWIDWETGEPAQRPQLRYDAWNYGQWRTVEAWGGLLVENIVQAVSRDIMVVSMFAAEKAGFPIILTVHDELVTEPVDTPSYTAKALEWCMSRPISWAPGWPIFVKAWAGMRYHK